MHVPIVGSFRRSFSPIPSSRPFCLCLGDSETYGPGIDVQDTWPFQLEHHLRTGLRRCDAHVVNAGQSGFSALDSALYYQLFLQNLRPDLIVWQLCGNDAEFYGIPPGRDPLEHLTDIWVEEHGHLNFFRQALSMVVELSPCPVLVFYVGDPDGAYDRENSAVVGRLCEESGADFVDGLAVLARVAQRNRIVGPEDMHMSAYAHGLLGKALSNHIKRQSLLSESGVAEGVVTPERRGIAASAFVELAVDRLPEDSDITRDIAYLKKGLLAVSESRHHDGLLALFKGRRMCLDGRFALTPSAAGLASERFAVLAGQMDKVVECVPGTAVLLAYCRSLAAGLSEVLAPLADLPGSDFTRCLGVCGANLRDRVEALFSRINLEEYLALAELDGEARIDIQSSFRRQVPLTEIPSISFTVQGRRLDAALDTATYRAPTGEAARSFGLGGFCHGDIQIGVSNNEYSIVKEVSVCLGDVRTSSFQADKLPREPRLTLRGISVLGEGSKPTPYCLERIKDMGRSERLAIFTASGATKAFLERYDCSDLAVHCLIDRALAGTSRFGYPVISPEDLPQQGVSFVLVTSSVHYMDIRLELMRLGLQEKSDFCLV